MGQAPDEIRDDIEETRARMTDTAEALAYKTDVRSRAKDKVRSAAGKVAEAADTAVDRMQGGAKQMASTTTDMTTHAGDTMKDGMSKATDQVKRGASIAQDNPLGLAIGAVAVGFVAGTLIPSTRMEDDKLGPKADEVRRSAKDLGREAMERGKEVATDTAEAAAQAAKETIQTEDKQQADQLRSSADAKTDRM
jgi:Protein of unknown function (DUF3618)